MIVIKSYYNLTKKTVIQSLLKEIPFQQLDVCLLTIEITVIHIGVYEIYF